MEKKYAQVKEILKKYNQEHLLQDYDEMNLEDKEKLLNQILAINFEQILNLYENTKKEICFEKDKIEPISFIDKTKVRDAEKYIKIGEEEIRKGKLAFVTMAGGQRYKTWSQRTKGNL